VNCRYINSPGGKRCCHSVDTEHKTSRLEDRIARPQIRSRTEAS
jgi:hypothetical protein